MKGEQSESVTYEEQKRKIEKILYKNQKRKTRNRLIYTVGLHILFIFGFVGFLCAEYLLQQQWFSYFYISVISDCFYWCYSLQILFSIKFKNRKLLISSLVVLALAIGTKAILFISLAQHAQINYLILGHMIFLVSNFMVPLILFLLWNKLNQKKWRQTFDLQTKLSNHLLQNQIN